MERLRNQRSASDPVVAEAARLLSSRQPLGDDGERKQRVRARLRRRWASSRRGTLLLRLAALLLLSGGVAMAGTLIERVAHSIGLRLQAARHKDAHRNVHAHAPGGTPRSQPPPPLAPPPPESLAPPAPPPPSLITAPHTPAPSPSPVIAVPPMPAPTPKLKAPRDDMRPAGRAHIVAASADRDDESAESDAQQLITSAVLALRHGHDPARATALLTRYLDRYPDGVATEDALALALEATLTRDPPRAAAFAKRYLSRYPSGRWSEMAQRALAP
jgi:hypothetical protein